MRRIILIFSAIMAVAVLFTGCATLLAQNTNPLAVSSEPSGADVYVNGARVGTTPVELNLKPDQSYAIEFRRDGFEPVTKFVHTQVDAGWVVLDIVLGLIPVIVDAATDAWLVLDQNAVDAVLVRQ